MSLINKIRIQNFKSLKDFEIEMKALMFLFGANSSGKSSFIKALSFLSKNIFPISDKGVNFKLNNILDLQDYSQIVHNGDTSLKVKYCIEIKPTLIQMFPYTRTMDEFFGKRKKQGMLEHIFHVKIEFSRNFSNNNAFISKVIIIDKTNEIEFGYIRGNYSWWDIQVISNKINIDLFNDYFSLNQSNKLNRSYESNIPFKDLSQKEIRRFLNYICEHLKSNLNVTEKQLSEKDFWESDGADYLKLLRIFTSIYYQIPNGLSYYFTNIYIPGIREIPKERYFLGGDKYLLGDKKFAEIDYYNLLNSLYDHQKSIVIEENKKEDDNKYINKYIKIFKQADLILSKFSKNQLNEIFNAFEIIIHNLFKEVKTYEDLFIYIKNNISELVNTNYGLTRFLELNNKQKMVIASFYQYNDEIKSLVEGESSFNPGLKGNFSLITNTSLIINHIIKKLGFDSIVYIIKDEGYGKLLSIKKNKAKLFLNNESSGYLQLLPIIFALVKIYASTHFEITNRDGYISRNESKEVNYFISRNEIRALYIEQPELHLHPKLQANIVEDIIVGIVNKFDNYNSLIIETHSEHIIKKMQVEIAKGNIINNKVGVYFFKKIGDISSCEKIKINEVGQLEKDFPEGFFDDSLNLSYEFYNALKNKS